MEISEKGKIPDISEKDYNSEILRKKRISLYLFSIPVLVVILAATGFVEEIITSPVKEKNEKYYESKGGEIKNAGKFNILSSEDLSGNIKDTVYTDKETWLELKIDQQMLYQHWRDGHVEKYPISSGNNKGGDPEALESRPGLFAIFHKEEHHQSSQFNSANMYHFMPFNQGIGFHSIDGTGYYANLGVRPSSHGCIRMKHADAEKLFGETPLGTLVLATKGYSARAIAFAPEGFENERTYEKDEYKRMLAGNLYNILNGKYYVEEREKFVVDPKVIPVSGVYISYDNKIPAKQIIPRNYVAFYEKKDKIEINPGKEILKENTADEFVSLVNYEVTDSIKKDKSVLKINSTDDLVKQYFNNPIGVLPYFGPKK
jgi:lipoprotein-anchoring transpeptidase ErfK/SrfK